MFWSSNFPQVLQFLLQFVDQVEFGQLTLLQFLLEFVDEVEFGQLTLKGVHWILAGGGRG